MLTPSLRPPPGGRFISSIRSIDLRLIDDLVDFVRGPGFVLDFSDASFSDFFASELKVNIDDPKYAVNGRSKGKRLRYFLQNCNDATAVRTLTALWEHRSEYLVRTGDKDPVANAEARYQALINRLSGGPNPPRPAAANPTTKAMSTPVMRSPRLPCCLRIKTARC